MPKKKKENNRDDKLDQVVALLKNKPEFIDKLLKLAEEPETRNESPSLAEAQKVLSDLIAGKTVELEKGPIHSEVWHGLSICATCGHEQKTYTSNPNGIVTQHICSSCRTKLGLMKTDAERYAFMQEGLSNDFLGAAKAKFKVMLERFRKGRKKQEDEFKKLANGGPDPMNFSVTGD